MSLIVAGVLAGLVLVSQSVGGLGGEGEAVKSRRVGIDAVSVVEVRVESARAGTQYARRVAGTVDSWALQLSGDETDFWEGDATRVRTVLRAVSTASLTGVDEESIGDVYGSLVLVGGDGLTTEVRFGAEAAGGFVRAEIVSRGIDGIATNRWFGRIDRSLRDSLVGEGLEGWRSMDLFGMTLSEVVGAEIRAGDAETSLVKLRDGWHVEPWDVAADSQMVQGMLGLTLGLGAERFYDEGVYSDDLTGLVSPIARIAIHLRDSTTTIEIGSAVDSSGKEIFARYTSGNGNSVVVAVSTEGLNRLTASPIAYVKKTVGGIGRADIGRVEILGTDGLARFACRAEVDSWVRVSGADNVVATPSQDEAIERLISVLTGEEAVRVYSGAEGRGEGFARVGVVVISERDGAEHRYEIAVEPGAEGMLVHVSRGFDDPEGLVWVLGSGEAAGSGAWIATLGSLPAESD